MVHSMTGYGMATCNVGDRKILIELRSVNHRFLELTFRGLPLPVALEGALRTEVKASLERGKVDVILNWEGGECGSRFQEEAFRRAYLEAQGALSSVGVTSPDLIQLTAVHLVSRRDMFQSNEALGTVPEEQFIHSFRNALTSLREMRRREGERLSRDMKGRADRLKAISTELQTVSSTHPAYLGSLVQNRMAKLPSELRVDEQRLAQEVAVLLDRADISEELVRLQSHLILFDDTLKEAPVGKKLEFISQEIGRELNTIGSKAQHPKIQPLVIEAKGELEKIREQVQNVE
jgi:uncharacterized protein (TIGR00255 family)